MKRITLLTAAAAALALLVSGCDLSLNLFSGMGLPEYDAAELKANASSDPSGTVEDIEKIIETEQVTDDNRDTLLLALEDAYNSGSASTSDKQKASLLSAQLEITGNSDSETLVTNTSSVINEILNASDPSNISDDELISSLTSGISGSTDTELQQMFITMVNAGDDYTDFSNLLGTDPNLSDGEKGDLLVMSTMSVVLRDAYNALDDDGDPTNTMSTDQQVLVDFIQGEATSTELENAFTGSYNPGNTTFSTSPDSDLMAIVNYADSSGDIYDTLASM